MTTLADLKAKHPYACFICGDWTTMSIMPEVHGCTDNPMMSALIAKAREDEAELAEADRALLFWRGYPEYVFSSDMEDGEPKRAVNSALARQAARRSERERG